MSIKFLVLGGGGYFGFWGGGSADFIFMGARIFLKNDSLSDGDCIWEMGPCDRQANHNRRLREPCLDLSFFRLAEKV